MIKHLCGTLESVRQKFVNYGMWMFCEVVVGDVSDQGKNT